MIVGFNIYIITNFWYSYVNVGEWWTKSNFQEDGLSRYAGGGGGGGGAVPVGASDGGSGNGGTAATDAKSSLVK